MASEPLGRLVFDANTLVSAFLFPNSRPGMALRVALQRGMLLTSLETVRELAEVLRRPKFDRYLTVKRREELLSAAVTASEIVEVTSVVRDCRDAGDNKYLELAVDGRATTIVTGDADLLTLDPWKGVRIVSPAEFLESVR